jgi:hypothetical protein
MIADLIAAGLQSGWRALRSPAMPATCGHDMDVPDSALKRTRRSSKASPVGPACPVNAARMLTPGAVMSGCRQQNVQVQFLRIGGPWRMAIDHSEIMFCTLRI